MTQTQWTEADSAKAREIWDRYQRKHDVSDRIGQTAGIDPRSGRVWFGESIPDVVAQRDADHIDRPLYFIRVGYDYYARKGRRFSSAAAPARLGP